jgi:hypothetical protein
MLDLHHSLRRPGQTETAATDPLRIVHGSTVKTTDFVTLMVTLFVV